ncbi:MAG: sigma-70 family RNA polymerase sigma factor, partial [Thermosynechococcaceae cyanobacterium]
PFTLQLPRHNGATRGSEAFQTGSKGRSATVMELAAAIDSSPEKIRNLIGGTRHPVSLDLKVGMEKDTALSELIEFEGQTPEEQATQTMLKEALDNVLAGLDSRERFIIEKRFGFGGGECQPLAEIGKLLNITRERVRQIEAKALRKLRKPGMREQMQGFLQDLG